MQSIEVGINFNLTNLFKISHRFIPTNFLTTYNNLQQENLLLSLGIYINLFSIVLSHKIPKFLFNLNQIFKSRMTIILLGENIKKLCYK